MMGHHKISRKHCPVIIIFPQSGFSVVRKILSHNCFDKDYDCIFLDPIVTLETSDAEVVNYSYCEFCVGITSPFTSFQIHLRFNFKQNTWH